MTRITSVSHTAAEHQPVAIKAPSIAVKDLVTFRGDDGVERPAIVTKVIGKTINAVVFGADHDDSKAGLKCGLIQKGDEWVDDV